MESRRSGSGSRNGGSEAIGKRRKFSVESKTRVALEALSGDRTVAELASEHDVHRNKIAPRKRQAKERLPEVITRTVSRSEAAREARIRELHEEIGL